MKKSQPYEIDFAQWYSQYPRKRARDAAYKAYASRRNKGVSAQQLLDAAKRFALECAGKDQSFIPYAATYLNSGQHLDGIEAPADLLSPKPLLSETHASWNGTEAKMIKAFGEEVFKTWLADAELVLGDPTKILTPKLFKANWIRNTFTHKLERLFGSIQVEVRK